MNKGYLNVGVGKDLENLMKINEIYSNFHCKILTSLKGAQLDSDKGLAMIEMPVLNDLIEFTKDLLETDLKHNSAVRGLNKSMLENFKVLQFSKYFEKNIAQMKLSLESFRDYFEESMKRVNLSLGKIAGKKVQESKTDENIEHRIKECLEKIFNPESVKKGKIGFSELDLNENLRCEIPENMAVPAKIKKMKISIDLCKKTLISLGKGLSEIYNPNKRTKNSSISPVNTKSDQILTKNIVLKVNRLLNRGSLTKEEAKRVILNLKKDSFQIDQRFETEPSPLTETRVKSSKHKSNFQNELEKALRGPKRTNKSCSVLKRRKSNHLSIPHNMSSSHLKSPKTVKNKLN